MSTRDTILTRFITDSGWAGATRTTVAGDASNRRYLRLSQGNETAILMDAPPDRGEDVGPFIAVAEHLRTLGLSAPRIMERDVEAGLLLIEDLGDDLFARVLKQHPEIENSLYSTAIDVLLVLHRHPPPDFLKPYSVAVMADLAALAAEWYAAGVQEPDGTLRDALRGAIERELPEVAPAFFFVDIQKDQLPEFLERMQNDPGVSRVDSAPMLRGLITRINGRPAREVAGVPTVESEAHAPLVARRCHSCGCRHAGRCALTPYSQLRPSPPRGRLPSQRAVLPQTRRHGGTTTRLPRPPRRGGVSRHAAPAAPRHVIHRIPNLIFDRIFELCLNGRGRAS